MSKPADSSDGAPADAPFEAKRIIREPGPGIEDPARVRPAAPDLSEGIDFIPEIEPLEGPNEASDNKDPLTPVEDDSPRLVDPTTRTPGPVAP